MSDFGGGGGEFIERLGIEIDLIDNASKAAINTVNELKVLNSTADQIEKSFGRANAAANQLAEGLRKLSAQRQAVLGGGAQPGIGSPAELGVTGTNLTAFDKQLQSHLALVEKAAQANLKFDQSLQIKAAGVQQVTAADKAIQSYGVTQARAIKENENFDKANDTSKNFLGRFKDGLDNVDSKLKESGLSVRSFSILLGAGLATGVVGIIRIFERLERKVADFVGSEIELERQTKLSFGSSTDSVNAFANNLAGQLGASRDEALKTANTFVQLTRTLQFPADVGRDLAIQLTSISAVLAQTQPGFKGTEDAAKAVEAALGGDTKGLAQLGITVHQFTEEALKDFRRFPDQLTPAEKAFVTTQLAAKAAGDSIQEFGVKGKSVPQDIKDFFKNFFSGAGNRAREIRDFNDQFDHLAKTGSTLGKDSSVQDLIDQINHLGFSSTKLKGFLAELGREPQTKDIHDVETAIENLITKRVDEREAADKQNHVLRDQNALLKINTQNFKDNVGGVQQQAISLIQALERATVEGNERVAVAQQNIARAIEDNASRSRDVAKRNADSLLSANQAVNDAELALTRAREDRAFRDQRAAENTAKVILDTGRANRKAAEDVTDFQREADRRIHDLQQKINQLKSSATQGLFDVQVQIINARLRGQSALAGQAEAELAGFARAGGGSGPLQQLKDAETQLARERQDDTLKLSRLRRTQKETELDGIAAVKKAQAEQSRAAQEGLRAETDAETRLTRAKEAKNRAIRDAADAITDLNKTNARAIQDANRALTDAQRARDQAIADASRALDEFAKTTGLAIDVIIALLEKMGLLTQEEINRINASRAASLIGVGGLAAGFMAGGDVPAARPVIWNEPSAGGELLITPSGGTVISHKEFQRLLALLEANGGGGHTFHLNVNEVSGSAQATAWRVGQEIMRQVG